MHKSQIIQVMDAIVRGTPAHWWVMHLEEVEDWTQVDKYIKLRF